GRTGRSLARRAHDAGPTTPDQAYFNAWALVPGVSPPLAETPKTASVTANGDKQIRFCVVGQT
ncbi:MAG: hypothetical protein ACXW3X_14125, partial [Rhodoplanes sp.]